MTNPVLTPLSYATILVDGDNAAQFLQGQLTCDVRNVTQVSASLGAVCNPQGRMLASLYLYKFHDCFYCLIPCSMVQTFINHLNKYAIFSKVMLRDASHEFRVWGMMHGKRESAENLPQQLYGTQLLTSSQIAIRVSANESHFILIEKKLTSNLESDSSDNSDQHESWRRQTILDGITIIYPQTSLQFTPHMLNYPAIGAVSFKKGCYVGQEIIARTQYIGKSKRHLHRAVLQTTGQVMIGGILAYQDQELGTIVDYCSLEQDLYLILAVIQEQADHTQLMLKGDCNSRLTQVVKVMQ